MPRFAVTVCAALSVMITALPAAAQDSRSLQDMLLAAVRLGDSAAVRSLLAAGADVAKRGTNGKTAIDVAVEASRFDIAELLVQERRRQRDAAIARSDGQSPGEVDVVQRSAEAAPEVVPQRVVSLPKPPLPAPPVTFVPAPAPQSTALPVNGLNGVTTVEQLLAVARQLTLAAQSLAAAQRAAIAHDALPQPVHVSQTVDPDFLPKPGRKPEIEQAALDSPAPATEQLASASNTVIVTPRRRTIDEGVEQARRDLEAGEDLPAILPAIATPPSSPTTDSTGSAIRGTGSFLGAGNKKSDVSDSARTAPPVPHARPESARDMKRDRANVPHVPARRASEFQSQPRSLPRPQLEAALQPPIQTGMPPIKAMPVAPVQEQSLTAKQSKTQLPPPNMAAPSVQSARLNVRKNSGLNPFDPDNMPQGSVLPLTDPIVGDVPEIARARMLPDEEKATEEASLRETLRRSAAKPQTVVPDVPPLRDPARSSGPTSMFERRAPQPARVAAAKPTAKPDDGILQSIANAVGIDSDDGEMPNDPPAGVSNSERVTTSRMPVVHLRKPLTDIHLTLGNSVATDQKPLPRGVAEPDPCIRRSGGALQFCVVPVDWHPRVDPAFSLTTYLYQGSRAIARYDAGKATHYHTLFNSLAYDDVVKYFTAKYGPPTDEWKRSIAPFDQPRQPNPTLVWRSKNSKTNKVTILEVRRYDDTRNVFPDMEHGAVRLYAAGAQRVFPVVTGMDLMGIDWAARSNHTDSPNGSALANTIRVGK